MDVENVVRLLNLIAGFILFVSTILQIRWQLTQAKRAEEETPGDTVPASGQPPQDKEAANLTGFMQVRQQNAGLAYFDGTAFWIFLIGFAVATFAAGLDFVAHMWLQDYFGIAP